MATRSAQKPGKRKAAKKAPKKNAKVRARKSLSLEDLDHAIEKHKEKLARIRGVPCFPLILADTSIEGGLVDKVFDQLRGGYKNCGQLDVIVDSGGGNLDAAYNLSLLFRDYGTERLTFIVPRWAKSAATLLVCAGDSILMTPVAELGPLDPQITEFNPLERRIEQFSPLHIESTLELIREEYKNGSEKLADGLMQRLQFPLTLGSFKKSLELGKQYLEDLLKARMLSGKDAEAEKVAHRLTEGYSDHSFCIKSEEARAMGLLVDDLNDKQLDIVWEIHNLAKRRRKIRNREKQERLREQLKDIPPELIQALPGLLGQEIAPAQGSRTQRRPPERKEGSTL